MARDTIHNALILLRKATLICSFYIVTLLSYGCKYINAPEIKMRYKSESNGKTSLCSEWYKVVASGIIQYTFTQVLWGCLSLFLFINWTEINSSIKKYNLRKGPVYSFSFIRQGDF